jgi:hypothetical protein
MANDTPQAELKPVSSFLTPILGSADPFTRAGNLLANWYGNNPRFLHSPDSESYQKDVDTYMRGVLTKPYVTRMQATPQGVDVTSEDYRKYVDPEFVRKDLHARQRERASRAARYGDYLANSTAAAGIILPLAILVNMRKIKGQSKRKKQEKLLDSPVLQVKKSAWLDKQAQSGRRNKDEAIESAWTPDVLEHSKRMYDEANRRGVLEQTPQATNLSAWMGDKFQIAKRHLGFDNSGTSSSRFADPVWAAGIGLGTVGAAYGTYKLVDWITDNMRRKKLQQEREALKNEYLQLLSSGLSKRSMLESALDDAADAFEKSASTPAAMDVAKNLLVLLGASGLGIGAYMGYTRGNKTNESEAKRKALKAAIRRMQLQQPPAVVVTPSYRKASQPDFVTEGYMSPQQVSVPLPVSGGMDLAGGPTSHLDEEEENEQPKSLLRFAV